MNTRGKNKDASQQTGLHATEKKTKMVDAVNRIFFSMCVPSQVPNRGGGESNKTRIFGRVKASFDPNVLILVKGPAVGQGVKPRSPAYLPRRPVKVLVSLNPRKPPPKNPYTKSK